jgi:hypothetical protein
VGNGVISFVSRSVAYFDWWTIPQADDVDRGH